MPIPRPAPRRLTAGLGATLAVVAALAGQPAAANPAAASAGTTPAGVAPTPAQQGALPAQASASKAQTLTLPTGDTAHVTIAGDRTNVVVDIARRSDGSRPAIITYTRGGSSDMYAVPADALPYVRAGVLDEGLFDVTYLARNGYGDADSTGLPLLVQFADESQARAASAGGSLPGAKVRRGLPTMHGVALSVQKKQAGAFWAGIQDPRVPPSQAGQAASPRLSHGVTKVWLDRKKHVALDVSVPLIGAPQAWAAGYDGGGVKVAVLDTGVDATHPDLAGRIAAARSFTSTGDTVDRIGHGTHVASTIAGSGAASSGRYRGVAPGTSLLVGKVCEDDGACYDSAIIAGMQWAADQGARVVSISLGGAATPDWDPLEQAVDDLTASTGTLFVIAAGNNGELGEGWVASPGTAESALTVAATDKSDQLAYFSSRGPLVWNGLRLMKPDIAAPGVSIVAARADGTELGKPVGDSYVTLNGTSMATPHVSGAAAILAQEHPDWKAPQLKAALMSTSKDVGYTVYEQGAGRVDVARASSQQVTASTGGLDFGRLEYPHLDPIHRTVTYTNAGDEPVTLSLRTSLTRIGDGPTPDGVLTADPSVTVPAHGSASATVTLNPAGVVGRYSGAVVATAEGVQLRTAVAALPRPQLYDVTLHSVGRAGLTCGESTAQVSRNHNCSHVMLASYMNVDAPEYNGILTPGGATTVRLPAGHYWFSNVLGWTDPVGGIGQTANINHPEVEVTGDTTVTFDLRTVQPLTVTTPQPTESYTATMTSWRADAAEKASKYLGVISAYGFQSYWTNTTPKVRLGRFMFTHQTGAGAPVVQMTVAGTGGTTFHPWYGNFYGDHMFSGTRNYPLVDIGEGISGDVGNRLRGKIVLLEKDVLRDGCPVAPSQLDALAAAGVAGMLVTVKTGVCDAPLLAQAAAFPALGLELDDAAMLRSALRSGPVELTVRGTSDTPYMYNLKFYHEGQVADTDQVADARDLSRTRATFHAQTPMWHYSAVGSWKDFQSDDVVGALYLRAPAVRDEYTGPIYPGERFLSVAEEVGTARSDDRYARLSPGQRPDEHWLTPLDAPGAAEPVEGGWVSTLCGACRQGNVFYPTLPLVHGDSGVRSVYTAVVYTLSEVHLYRGEQEVPMTPLLDVVSAYTLPEDDRDTVYRLTSNWVDWVPEDVYGTHVESEWRFHSSQPDAATTPRDLSCVGTVITGSTQPCAVQPLVYLRYDLGLDPDNRTGRSAHAIHVTAYHEGSTQAAPPIRSFSIVASFDGGRTWTPTKVSGTGGDYTVTIPQAPKGAGDTVTLRATAEDAAGNSITQTSYHAYGLRSS